jgi:hypothetical protein
LRQLSVNNAAGCRSTRPAPAESRLPAVRDGRRSQALRSANSEYTSPVCGKVFPLGKPVPSAEASALCLHPHCLSCD